MNVLYAVVACSLLATGAAIVISIFVAQLV